MMHAPVASPALPSSFSSSSSANTSAGGRLVSTTGRALPLLGTSLSVDAAGGIARVVVEQRFHNPHAEPLAVTYSLPLPADGAVSGFAFRVGGRRVVGEVDKKQVARERYEQALIEGRSAAILEQDRSSLFTQEIGNIPPGEEIIAEVVIDQRLVWIDEGAWEWRFPTVVGPRYLGESGRVPDAMRVSQDIADGSLPARLTLSCVVRDAIVDGGRPESPSHALTSFETRGAVRIELKEKLGARLDRDVVVRWPVAAPEVGLALDTGRAPLEHARAATAYGLLTVVPPSVEGARRHVARDLIVLLDTSGSMGGEPLAQAQRITTALIDTLRDGDQLELIEFSSSARRWKRGPVAADAKARGEASAWVRALRASGSTEMRDGILAAMSSLRDGAQRQIVLITDGMIGFESQVVAAIAARLPSASRLHTVGVGSAVNRSLTGPAARAGHGLEVVIGIGEDPERAVARLLARTSAPLLVELALSGPALLDHAPLKLPDLFAGAPALISVALRPEGGELCVRGRTVDGAWEQRLHVATIAAGAGNQAAVALFAREAVEDLETHLAGGGDAREINATIEGLGVDFQIATRLTSWVAVSRDATVDPRDACRRERMPHELPHGLSAEGVGLRSPAPVSFAGPAGYAEPLYQKMKGQAPTAAMAPIVARAPAARPRMAMPASASVSAPAPGFAPPPPPPPAAPASPMHSRSAPKPSAPAKSEAAREEGGFLDKVKRALGFGSSAEEAKPAAPLRTLRGRVVLHNAHGLVIEVLAANDALAWKPGATATIELADGTIITAAVDFAKTTRAGTIAVGASARLGLALPHGTSLVAPIRVTIDVDGGTLVVDL
jgi:Ca-activated chloride channel family protein